ncbi:hypothetical protein NC651_017704 [Populus alba x Populus x berolinensis]|nr:hypothetical protein NC651_017704 [Populus alba x Populus x berolinensis]
MAGGEWLLHTSSMVSEIEGFCITEHLRFLFQNIARRCDDVAFYPVNFSWLLVVVVPVAMHVFELIIGDYHKSMV